MKIIFKTNDSLYHIFKTVKKIPSWKKVSLFVEPQHTFFEHEWRGKQLQEILKQYNIQATFLVGDRKSAQYFQKLGIPFKYKHKNIFQK